MDEVLAIREFTAMTFRTSTRLWAPVAALLLGAACASGPSASVTYHDSNMDFSLIQTVAVLPLGNLSAQPQASERVRDVLATMLQATGAVYVLPPGEVNRGISRLAITTPATPNPEQVVQLAQIVKADVVITGVVREYGEVRSGGTAANVISVSLQMMEAQTGKVVWSASASRGGIGVSERLFGGGGAPLNKVTEQAIKDLIDKLFE